jgi:hypothetical protein
MFLAACTELTGGPGETIAPGIGQVHIRLDKLNARTVLPGLDGLHFTLDFTATGKTSVNETLNKGLMTLTVALESGTWDLEVKGYSNSNILTVRGKSTITITAGISSNVTVYLTPDFSSGGTGQLDYDISFPGTTRAFLGLYPLHAQGTGQEINISESAKETINGLPAGSYQIFIDLYDGENNKAAVWTGVVHIYDGSTTSLNRTFDDLNFATCPPVVEAGENTLAAKLEAALASESGSYTIVLDATEGAFAPKDLKVTGNKNITLILRGSGETVHLNGNGSLFTLGAESGSSLTLVVQDITLEGKSNNTAPVVQVNSGGTLEVKVGSSLTGNTSNTSGGGVLVDSGGTLSMSGGEISGNTVSGGTSCGGGVYINGGTFTMSSGTISGNKTSSSVSGAKYGGGGVFVTNGGTFTMSGGEVSNNTSAYDCGGVFVYGTGTTFEMSGGEVSSNSASQSGGGVYISGGGTLNMSGGEVSGNSVTNGNGGGVYAREGTFTMSGGVIYGSEAENGSKKNTGSGAALYTYGGTVNPTDLVTGTTTNTTIVGGQLTP